MRNDRFYLDGKTALVTGATRGIGYAIAGILLDHGASVLITARRQDELEAAAASLRERGRVEAFTASAGDPDAVTASAAACVERLGAIDVLVNNAATNPQFGPLVEAEMGTVEKVWSVNLLGPLLYCRAAWELSMRERGGSIINVSSVSGVAPVAMTGAYNIAKAGLIHLSRQLAIELGPGVRANTLIPGLVRTRFGQVQFERHEEAVTARHPLGRLGVPADLAGAALFLASPMSSWMTGQMIVVDGGAMQTWWPIDDEGHGA